MSPLHEAMMVLIEKLRPIDMQKGVVLKHKGKPGLWTVRTRVGNYGGWILWQGNKSANVFSDELSGWMRAQ